jgi:hypothetical protein
LDERFQTTGAFTIDRQRYLSSHQQAIIQFLGLQPVFQWLFQLDQFIARIDFQVSRREFADQFKVVTLQMAQVDE